MGLNMLSTLWMFFLQEKWLPPLKCSLWTAPFEQPSPTGLINAPFACPFRQVALGSLLWSASPRFYQIIFVAFNSVPAAVNCPFQIHLKCVDGFFPMFLAGTLIDIFWVPPFEHAGNVILEVVAKQQDKRNLCLSWNHLLSRASYAPWTSCSPDCHIK